MAQQAKEVNLRSAHYQGCMEHMLQNSFLDMHAQWNEQKVCYIIINIILQRTIME